MQVILLERVAKLGQMGDVVSVKDGYARNYLLPQKKALWASEANIKTFESDKAQLEARNLETKKEADALADKLNGQQFILIRQASDVGSLYGSVTPRDAAEVASDAGFTIDKRQVAIVAPIKELGVTAPKPPSAIAPDYVSPNSADRASRAVPSSATPNVLNLHRVRTSSAWAGLLRIGWWSRA